MFPGYVFYDRAAVDRLEVFASRKVAGILVPDEPEQLREDLESLATALRTEPGLKRCDFGPPGTPVQVLDGPLAGTVGELVRRGARSTLVLRVRFLGFSAETTIDENHVRPLGRS
jgi:hypothetical protein